MLLSKSASCFCILSSCVSICLAFLSLSSLSVLINLSKTSLLIPILAEATVEEMGISVLFVLLAEVELDFIEVLAAVEELISVLSVDLDRVERLFDVGVSVVDVIV